MTLSEIPNLAHKDTVFSRNRILNLGGDVLDLTTPVVAGILNITPDSFYDGGKYPNEKDVLQRAELMLSEGAGLIDIGGYSTRPGAEEVSEKEEISRVIPSIKSILKEFPQARLSVDTFRSMVAEQAVREGAVMINDVSGGEADKNMFETVARLGVPYVIMHMRGTPQTMTTLTDYEDILLEMLTYFENKINQLRALGVEDISIDPGFGFAKTKDQSFFILKNLAVFGVFGVPVMVGISRKSMIRNTLNVRSEDALNGTTVLHTAALERGADILRVHDVKEAVEAVKLITQLRGR